jgi:hypothetical protein
MSLVFIGGRRSEVGDQSEYREHEGEMRMRGQKSFIKNVGGDRRSEVVEGWGWLMSSRRGSKSEQEDKQIRLVLMTGTIVLECH